MSCTGQCVEGGGFEGDGGGEGGEEGGFKKLNCVELKKCRVLLALLNGDMQ